MNFRLAVMQDLLPLQTVYKEIIETMNRNGIPIWDDVYPCEFFEDDIKNKQLYILSNKDEIISAFALCDFHPGEPAVKWKNNCGTALYLDRFGVAVKYSKKGIGSFMLKKAIELTKTAGMEYLRLFVVDINKPAINLYTKNGFWKADGIYNEMIDNTLVLHEFGYEIDSKL